MKLNNDNEMVVTNEKGEERLLHILFTYENEERQAQYVFFYEVGDKEENVMVMKYTDEGDLIDVEDDEEYEEVEEVFNAWQEDPKIQELKNN